MNSINRNDYEIAIFSKDLSFCSTMSKELRDFKVIVPTITKLPKIIESINDRKVDLIFIDLNTFKECYLILGAHPKILSRSTLIVICTRPGENISTSHELSASGSFIYQIVRMDDDFTLSLQSILNWVKHNVRSLNLDRSRVRELNLIKERFENTFNVLQKNEEAITKVNEKVSQFENISEIVLDLKKKNIYDKDNFIVELSKVLNSWSDVTSFSYYALSPSKTSLTTLELDALKYVDLPMVELGDEAINGIGPIAQEQIYQMAFNEMGLRTLALRIEGVSTYPEVICFVSFKENKFDSLVESKNNWDLFESLLSSIYRGVLIQDIEHVESSEFITIWDALNIMDETDSEEFGYKFFNIDLLAFNRFVSKNRHLKFNWRSFFSDILIMISQEVGSQCKITTFGSAQILVLVPAQRIEAEFSVLKKVVESIEYWKYFSDTTVVMPRYVYPKVNLVPRSSSFYLSKILFGEGSRSEVARIHENTFSSKDF